MKRLLLLLLAALALPAYSQKGKIETFLGCYGDFCQVKVESTYFKAPSGEPARVIRVYDCENVRVRFIKETGRLNETGTPEWYDLLMGTVGFDNLKKACDNRKKK